MAPLFGFIQLDLPGRLPLPDGRYLARDDSEDAEESVLVLQTIGAPRREARRRSRPRPAASDAPPAALALTRVTAIRASHPFASETEAKRWLDEATEADDSVAVLLDEGVALLNRALHARAVASGDARAEQAVALERAATVRVGYGSGEETAAGRFAEAREVDPEAGSSRRQRRERELRPQERLAGVLSGRRRLDACETLLLRARADLDAGREREAALQLRVGLEALLAEVSAEALGDEGHRQDLQLLSGRLPAAAAAAAAAARGPIGPAEAAAVAEILAVAERLLRRRRILNP